MSSDECDDTDEVQGGGVSARLAAALEGVLSAAEEVLPSIALGVAVTAASTAWGWGEGWLPSNNNHNHNHNHSDSDSHSTSSSSSSSSSSISSSISSLFTAAGARRAGLRLGFLAASLPLQMCEHAVVTLALGLLKSHAATPGAAAAWV